MPSSDTVLITGASGFIGSHAVAEFARAGYTVKATSRHRPAVLDEFDAAQATFVPADLRDTNALARAVEGVSAVVHIGGLFDFFASTADLMDVNARGTDQLCTLAQEAGATCFVYLSSGAIYGGGGSRDVFDEQTPANPWDDYAKSKWAGEQAAAAHHRADAFRVVTFRAGAVYGPRSTYGSAQALYLMKRGVLFGIPGMNNPLSSHIHVEDVARALRHAVETQLHLPDTAGTPADIAFNLADDEPMALEDLLGLADSLITDKGLTGFHRIKLPASMLKASARVLEGFAKVTRTRPLFEVDGIEYLTSGRALANGRLKESGFHLQYPTIREGLPDTIRWYDDTNWTCFREH